MTPADERLFLRHLLATIAYRGAKAVRGAPASFAAFKASPKSRTPHEILAHIGDLMAWGRGMVSGEPKWSDGALGTWDEQCARFHRELAAFDAALQGEAPLAKEWKRIAQGPLADALQHVGQITMLRRVAGAPILGENYFLANIETGRVGEDQPPGVKEFE